MAVVRAVRYVGDGWTRAYGTVDGLEVDRNYWCLFVGGGGKCLLYVGERSGKAKLVAVLTKSIRAAVQRRSA